MTNVEASQSSGKYYSAEKLNIGGGPHFKHNGWVNLESVQSPQNPSPFTLGPSAIFPIASGSVLLVYSSHCLEHLDDATVEQTLKEARRVLGSEGVLFLKLPDFELTQQKWRAGDHSHFTKWDLERLQPLWQKRGVPDTIDTRAAMVYCGFWNAAYGDHFSGKVNSSSDAYHGPSVQAASVFKELMQLNSQHEISKRLCDLVRKNESSYIFNHQNAWGRDELVALLAKNGLRVLSFDREKIIRHYAQHVPGIYEMFDISMYCIAEPV